MPEPGALKPNGAHDLVALRARFPITESCVYLNHAAAGPPSADGRDAMTEIIRSHSATGPSGQRSRALLDHVRQGCATLVGAHPSDIAFVRSTTYGIAILAASLPWSSGDNVVIAAGEFPGVVYPWLQAGRRGVETRFAASSQFGTSPEGVFAVVDGRTRVVMISFVEFRNGHRNDLAAIGDECRRRGIVFAVDAAQGLGALRLSVGDSSIDFLSVGGHKWLLSPQGTGFVYVHPRLAETLEPPIVGMDSVVRSDGFFEYSLTLAPNARRLEEASPNIVGAAGLGATLDLLAEFGTEWIERRVIGLAVRLRSGLLTAGAELVSPQPSQLSGIVSFRHPRRDSGALQNTLWDGGFRVALRGDFLRAAPHFYNSESEIDRLVEAIALT